MNTYNLLSMDEVNLPREAPPIAIATTMAVTPPLLRHQGQALWPSWSWLS